MALPIRSLGELQEFLEDPESSYIAEKLGRTNYPVYGVLLYERTNGFNEWLSEYVDHRFPHLFHATGHSWLLVAYQPNPPYGTPDSNRPDAPYEVARSLGAEHTDLPCIIFFTEPRERSEILVVRLSIGLLSAYRGTYTDTIDQLFRTLGHIAESCGTEPEDRRLSCLKLEIDGEWPGVSTKISRALEEEEEVARGTPASARSIFGALNAILSRL